MRWRDDTWPAGASRLQISVELVNWTTLHASCTATPGCDAFESVNGHAGMETLPTTDTVSVIPSAGEREVC